MQNTTLTLGEILDLVNEIYGPNGLLKQKISITTKYWLNDLGEQLIKEQATIKQFHDELVIKYGAEIDGVVKINISIDDSETQTKKINPKYLEFSTEYNNLLAETKNIQHKTFNLSDLNEITTEEDYKVFRKLITVE
jgi:hypothetical protein